MKLKLRLYKQTATDTLYWSFETNCNSLEEATAIISTLNSEEYQRALGEVANAQRSCVMFESLIN